MRHFAICLAALVVCIAAHAQQIQVSSANRTISVTATEQAERRADTATVHVGYQLYAATSERVTQDAGARSKAITDALKQAGVPDDAIESVMESTGPVQGFQGDISPEERADRKFQAQQEWTVRVTAKDAAKTLAAAVATGANQSGAIDWSVADESTLNAEAAGKALQHAQAIAMQMAAGLHATLGPLVFASNQAKATSLTINGRVLASDGPAAPKAQDVVLVLSPQLIRRSATVSAVFSLQ